jgi:hypothetical protein
VSENDKNQPEIGTWKGYGEMPLSNAAARRRSSADVSSRIQRVDLSCHFLVVGEGGGDPGKAVGVVERGGG